MIRFADRFVLEREIGSGGMSVVFLGRDEVLDRPVAIKLLRPGYAGTDIGARFQREGRTAASLSHPNIVQVYDAGEGKYEGREASYIVMEYVPGGDLKALIDRRGSLSGGELLRLSEVAAGLTHAHERGVIHRDVKPHNILLDENGRPKISDFGIARALDATHATRTGSYLGTALYSSPEQLKGERVTPKSDVYSLGATLYHAATGQPPFVGAPIEIASQHVSRKPTPPCELNDAVSPALEALILDCMKKDPDARPSADEVRLGLLEAGRGVHATEIDPEPPRRRPPGQSPPVQPRHRDGAPRRVRPVVQGGEVGTGGEGSWLLSRSWPCSSSSVPSPAPGSSAEETIRPEARARRTRRDRIRPEAGRTRRLEAVASRPPRSQRPAPAGQAGGEQAQASSGSSEAQAAERAVQEFYISSSAGDYDRSAQLLSEGWRQSTFPNRATFEGTFDMVESVEFSRGRPPRSPATRRPLPAAPGPR